MYAERLQRLKRHLVDRQSGSENIVHGPALGLLELVLSSVTHDRTSPYLNDKVTSVRNDVVGASGIDLGYIEVDFAHLWGHLPPPSSPGDIPEFFWLYLFLARVQTKGFLRRFGKSIGILTARQTEIVNCNWEGIASIAPPKVGQICIP